jgi:hypothetical protein
MHALEGAPEHHGLFADVFVGLFLEIVPDDLGLGVYIPRRRGRFFLDPWDLFPFHPQRNKRATLAEFDFGTVGQRRLLDTLTVEKRAVCAVQVLEPALFAFEIDTQVKPAYATFHNPQVTLLASPYDEAGSKALFSLSGLASYNPDYYGNGSGG